VGFALSRGLRVFATASDDFHVRGERGSRLRHGPGRSEPEAIRSALLEGDFYASTGLLLARCERSGSRLSIAVDPQHGAVRFEVIGPGGTIVETKVGAS